MDGLDLSVAINMKEEFQVYADEAYFMRFLRRFPAKIGLESLEPPILYRFPSVHVPGENGISGMILMVQSHLAFHWWPDERFLHITVSSCKRFDLNVAIGWLEGFFFCSRKEMKTKIVEWQ